MSIVKQLLIHDIAELDRFTANLAQRLRGDETLGLVGELGAGKTWLTKSLATALGVTRPILSPTFVLERSYPISQPATRLHHIDAYRISPDELVGLGVSDWLGEELGVIEWADRVGEILPADTVWIKLVVAEGDTRTLELTCPKSREYLCQQ